MKKILLLALTIGLFTACTSEDQNEAENNFLTQSKSGNCGLDVVSDYNSAILDCKYMRSRSDINECVSKLNRFKTKYPGVNCSAERGYGLDKETFTITTSHINGLLSGAQNL